MDACPRCAAMFAGLGWAVMALAQAPSEQELSSCVSGSPPLRVSASARRAVLDAADRHRMHQAAQARYPLYQSAPRAPAQVLLMQRGGGWQYVTLWPGGPAGLCFSAVFAAERFDFTPDWVAKYQPRPADLAD